MNEWMKYSTARLTPTRTPTPGTALTWIYPKIKKYEIVLSIMNVWHGKLNAGFTLDYWPLMKMLRSLKPQEENHNTPTKIKRNEQMEIQIKIKIKRGDSFKGQS